MRYIRLLFMPALMLAACNPVSSPTPPAAAASTPPAIATPFAPSATASPSATAEPLPTLPTGPTSTAIPTLRPGRAIALASLHMIDEQQGWGIDAGGHIVRTADGGKTWKDITPYHGAYQDRGFFALDANTAWATSDEQACHVESCAALPNNVSVWHTTDGGDTWQAGSVCVQGQECGFDFDIVLPDFYHPIAIRFVDARAGWLLVTVAHLMFQDRYRLYQTLDGGAHWSPLMDSFQGPMTNGVTGLAFEDKQTGWLSTSEIDGASDPIADWSIYRSTDAGRTWNEFALPEPNPLPKTFANNTAWCGVSGVAVVSFHALGVIIQCRVYTNPLSVYDFYFHSTDGGQHWISWLKTGDVDFIDPDTGWRSTFDNRAYNIEQTHDGGQTWTRLKTVKWNGILDFVNEQTGWAIATSDNVVALVHTTDGGQTWQELRPLVAGP